MYEPDEGRILINGIDRNDFPKEEWYRLFSIVFQETLILPFTVGENLAMDRAERVDEEKAWKALEQAGLKQTFRERGIHIRSYMTKTMMEDGVELSGGQKQRFRWRGRCIRMRRSWFLTSPRRRLTRLRRAGYTNSTTDTRRAERRYLSPTGLPARNFPTASFCLVMERLQRWEPMRS